MSHRSNCWVSSGGITGRQVRTVLADKLQLAIPVEGAIPAHIFHDQSSGALFGALIVQEDGSP